MKELNPTFKRHLEKPQNAGILERYNCHGTDTSLKSGAIVIYYGHIGGGKINDISFRAFGCSHSIAASSCITSVAKGKDLFKASMISGDDIEKKLGIFPPDKKDSLNTALGAFYAMLSSYITSTRGKSTGIPDDSNRIVVAMSGGLDSSMAAKLLLDKGFDITGITMKTMPDGSLPPGKRTTSWISSDIYSARRVSSFLGIPHFIVDLSQDFDEKIIGPFCDEYMQGRTPNPCVECNKHIKFGILLDITRSLGAKHIATGHYCLVERQYKNGPFVVRKGIDRSKDQSYMFWKLDQSQLSYIMTPLGSLTKEDVRSRSMSLLPLLEDRGESQDICFINGDRYHEFLRGRIKDTGRGKIINTAGKTIGEHRGFPYYTIGQRKGLGISHPRPLYVKEIIPEKNMIIACEKEELLRESAYLRQVNLISGQLPGPRFSASVKIRYNSPAVKADIIPGKGRTATVLFKKTVSSVTPGQSAVFYDRDLLLGGGIIDC